MNVNILPSWIRQGRESRGKSLADLAAMLMIAESRAHEYEVGIIEPDRGMRIKIEKTFARWDEESGQV